MAKWVKQPICMQRASQVARGKEPACHCRRHKTHGFDPGVGKILWRRVLQRTPIFLPEESHGQRSLEDYSPWGHKELDMTERYSMHPSLTNWSLNWIPQRRANGPRSIPSSHIQRPSNLGETRSHWWKDATSQQRKKKNLYSDYKRHTSHVKIHTDWNWRDRKRYFMQMEIKRKMG